MRAARRILAPSLGLAIGLAGACFNAPQPAVHFSCEPDGASECPEGYTCQSDGCCHLDGTNFEDHEGECQLAGGLLGTGATDPGLTGESGDALTDDSTGNGSTDPSGSTDPGSTGEGSTGEGSTGEGSTGEGGTTAGSDSGGLTSGSSSSG